MTGGACFRPRPPLGEVGCIMGLGRPGFGTSRVGCCQGPDATSGGPAIRCLGRERGRPRGAVRGGGASRLTEPIEARMSGSDFRGQARAVVKMANWNTCVVAYARSHKEVSRKYGCSSKGEPSPVKRKRVPSPRAARASGSRERRNPPRARFVATTPLLLNGAASLPW
jgi:hypothetical protein